MKIKHIYYISDSESTHIADCFKKRYASGFSFSNTAGNNNFREMFSTDSLLMIFEPFEINSAYYSIYKLWKRWCKNQAPFLKIIVAGLDTFQSPNYLDLLNMPEDFTRFIDRALPADCNWQLTTEDTGQCSDILEKMQLFFAGHGQQSLIAQLNKIKVSLNIAETRAAQEGEQAFEKISNELLYPYLIPEWKAMMRRWERYSEVFELIPFLPEFHSIETTFQRISGFFDTLPIQRDRFFTMHLDEKIRTAFHQLKAIDNTYIRPDIYEC